MSHWRSLLQLAFLALVLPFQSLAANIQGQPTTWIYVTGASSYDATSRDLVSKLQLNGQVGMNPAHLGAKFAGPYVDRVNAFGLLAWDTMVGYANNALLNGLNLGAGEWPNVAPTNTPYVDRDNYLPQLVFDNLTNYVNGAILAGSDSCYNCTNLDQGPTTLWNGPFVEGLIGSIIVNPTTNCSPGVICTGPSLTNAAYASLCSAAFYYTTDGSTPTTNSTFVFLTPGCGSTNISLPDPTFNFQGFVTGPIFHGPVVNYTLCSIGTCWSNQVVVNGGANPSRASVTNINNFWQGLLADWGANPPVVYSMNLMATDSLTAAITPQIWRQIPNQQLLMGIWTNHNFVAGDLTVNGLTGDAVTKYLDSGVDLTLFPSAQSSSVGIYAYTANASGVDVGAVDGTPVGLSFASKFTDNNTRGRIGPTLNVIAVASPGNGFYLNTRTSSTAHNVYFANSGTGWASIGSDATAFSSAFPGALNLYFGCQNNNGIAASFTSDTLSGGIFCAGLTTGQGQSLFNRWQSWRQANNGGFR